MSRKDPDFILGIDANILSIKTTFDGHPLMRVAGRFDGDILVNHSGQVQLLLGGCRTAVEYAESQPDLQEHPRDYMTIRLWMRATHVATDSGQT